MSWKLDITIKEQPVPLVTLIVSMGEVGSAEVVESILTNDESLLHIKAGLASDVVYYLDSEGLPGIPPITGLDVELLLDGEIDKDNNKLTLSRAVDTVDFESKEDVYKTGIVTGLTSFGERWVLRFTSTSPIDLTKEQPKELVIIEAVNNLEAPNNASDFSDIPTHFSSRLDIILSLDLPENFIGVPSYDSEKFRYMGYKLALEFSAVKENLATGVLEAEEYTQNFTTSYPGLVLGRLDYTEDILGTYENSRETDTHRTTLTVTLIGDHIFTYDPGLSPYSRKLSTNLEGSVLHRTQVLSGTKISTLLKKTNQSGDFFCSLAQGDLDYRIEGSDISEEPLFEILKSDLEPDIHFTEDLGLDSRATPDNPLPLSDQISEDPPSDYPPGTFSGPSFNSLGERTS